MPFGGKDCILTACFGHTIFIRISDLFQHEEHEDFD